MPSEVVDAIARDDEKKRKVVEAQQKAAQGGPGSALKLAKLLQAHATPPEQLQRFLLRTIDIDDKDEPEPIAGEADPRDVVRCAGGLAPRALPWRLPTRSAFQPRAPAPCPLSSPPRRVLQDELREDDIVVSESWM